MEITWRKSWISYYESPISIMDKICYANQITAYEFSNKFSSHEDINHSFILGNNVDYQKLEGVLGEQILSNFHLNIKSLCHCFFNGEKHPESYLCRDLFLCNSCSLLGYHSLLFQSKFIIECPFHQTPLTNRCRKCDVKLMYSFRKNHTISQCCRNCAEPFLYHMGVYPNYPKFSENHIQTAVLLDWFNLDEQQKLSLSHIVFSKPQTKSDLSFILYSVNESVKNRGKII